MYIGVSVKRERVRGMRKEKFEKEIVFYPAFDKGREGGIGDVRIYFYLKGRKGVIQFLMSTGWYLGRQYLGRHRGGMDKPDAWDIGYHSPKPMYKGQKCIQRKCEVLGGKRCYYGGSGLRAKPLLDILLQKGSEGIWKELEKEYYIQFGK